VLEWELAEPTPFRISPGRDSVSSAGGGADSGAELCLSTAKRIDPTSSKRRPVLIGGVSTTGPILGDPTFWVLDFSLSFALSLAARGADGKNCAKLAPDARDIVEVGTIYLTLRLPSTISCV